MNLKYDRSRGRRASDPGPRTFAFDLPSNSHKRERCNNSHVADASRRSVSFPSESESLIIIRRFDYNRRVSIPRETNRSLLEITSLSDHGSYRSRVNDPLSAPSLAR